MRNPYDDRGRWGFLLSISSAGGLGDIFCGLSFVWFGVWEVLSLAFRLFDGPSDTSWTSLFCVAFCVLSGWISYKDMEQK